MSKHLQNDLTQLEQEVLAQSSMVEEMIEKACRGLREIRADIAAEVIAQERQIDLREIRIEEACLKVLALHQPVAVDLRRAATVLKVNNELERIADLAVNIAERTQSLVDYPEFVIPANLERMAQIATAMVHDALDAFVNLDADLARDICHRDDHVDHYNREVIAELRRMMRDRSEVVEPALHFFSAARQVERIADHATNIAEDVIYLVEGEIARHGGMSLPEESP
jgi:phosphate transport system protein